MKRVVAVGFVLLFTAGTAFAANTADTRGSFLDRAASFFGLRSKSAPEQGDPGPSGRKALGSRTPEGGQSCTCVGPGGHVIFGDPNDPDGPCAHVGKGGTLYQMP